MATPSDVGRNIKRARKERGWSQDEFARLADIKVDSLRAIESGKNQEPRDLEPYLRTLELTEQQLRFGWDDATAKSGAAESRIETEVLSSLLDYFARAEVSLEHRAALVEISKELVAGDGRPDWAEEHRKLSVPDRKRVNEPPPEAPKLGDGLRKMPRSKR